MTIDKLTPNVRHWIGLTFGDTEELWDYLTLKPSVIPQAIAEAQKCFDRTYPNLPFDKLAQENRRRIEFEFYIVRYRFAMPQRTGYDPDYFNELCRKWGMSL